MPTAEDLLRSDESTSDLIVIDAINRKIIIPEAEKLFGVESDAMSETKRFTCPKIVGDGVDLSTLQLRINYETAAGTPDFYVVDDVQVDGDNIKFSWRLDRLVFEKGTDSGRKLTFSMCAIDNDSKSVEWNTTINQDAIILPGLETEKAIADLAPTILEAIVKKYVSGMTVGEGGSVTVDSTLNRTSENPVQNRAIYQELAKKVESSDIPETLKNPEKLTITVDGTEYGYDGSGAVAISIKSGDILRVEKGAADTSVELEPNKSYVFPEMAELTVTLATGDADKVSEYHFIFMSGATATQLTLPGAVKYPDGFNVEANKIYEISIVENLLTYQSWAVS